MPVGVCASLRYHALKHQTMNEIVFNVEWDEESSFLVASWDDPRGGGMTTQGADLRELQEMILDATAGYFDAADGPAPSRARLHFVTDPELALA
jgi:hypothetical protein